MFRSVKWHFMLLKWHFRKLKWYFRKLKWYFVGTVSHTTLHDHLTARVVTLSRHVL